MNAMKYLFDQNVSSLISKPLVILFRNSFINNCFPKQWKKDNTTPVHKKTDKQLARNYRPVSLLFICDKILKIGRFN